MKTEVTTLDQAAFVAEMARRQPGIGRTALMKYAYLLQEVRGVPLGFDFTLYAYGPYDTAVLNGIDTAERWLAVQERTVHYPGGTGYEIYPTDKPTLLMDWGGDFLKAYEADLDWVVREFGRYSAGNMELIGTMVFADREAAEKGEVWWRHQLIDTVLKIKPRFSREQAEVIYDELLRLEMLTAVREDYAVSRPGGG